MTTISIRAKLAAEDLVRLQREFPSCKTHLFDPEDEIPESIWADTEVFFGDRLGDKELALARRLRWVHVPKPHTDGLCEELLNQQSHWLITTSFSQEPERAGCYVMGAVLAFSQQLFCWYEATRNRNSFEVASDLTAYRAGTFLQVGLGWLGGIIAEHALAEDYRVWGVKQTPTFHPFCQKVFAYRNLPALLPAADVICLCPHTIGELHEWLSAEHLDLIEEDKILVVLGGLLSVTEKDFTPLFKCKKKLRGVLIDAHFTTPPGAQSGLWKVPNLIISPNLTAMSSSPSATAARSFRKNLALFLHNDIAHMRHLVHGHTKPFLESFDS